MTGFFIALTLIALAGLIGFLLLYKKISEKQTVPEIKVYVNANQGSLENKESFLTSTVDPQKTVPTMNPAELLKLTPTTSHIKWDN